VSINPISDIVLDVARAADPVKSQTAAEKLSRKEGTSQVSIGSFDHVLAHTPAMVQAAQKSLGDGGSKSPETLPRIDSRTKAYKGLEQLVLKNLMENLLPKESKVLFGTGTAGDFWRSFLADQLATQLGKSVNLGIVHQPTAAFDSHARQTTTLNPVQMIPRNDPALLGWL